MNRPGVLSLLVLALGALACASVLGSTATPTPDHRRLGLDALDRQEYARAIQEFALAIDAEPQKAELYYLRGSAYYERYRTAFERGSSDADPKDVDRAIADFTLAIGLDPGYAEAYNYRGLAYAAYDREDEALKDYNQAIELKPDLATTYYGRGYLYEQRGQRDLAIADYEHFLELSDDPAWRAEAQKRLDALQSQAP